MSNQQNRIRQLDGLFSVDAWHAAFDANNATADFFIDVTFETGRYGGEEGSEILFTAGLKRATIVIVLPEGGTYEVDPKSVNRTMPVKADVSETKHTHKAWSASVASKLSRSMNHSAEASANAGSTVEEFRKLSSEEFPITEKHGKDGKRVYADSCGLIWAFLGSGGRKEAMILSFR